WAAPAGRRRSPTPRSSCCPTRPRSSPARPCRSTEALPRPECHLRRPRHGPRTLPNDGPLPGRAARHAREVARGEVTAPHLGERRLSLAADPLRVGAPRGGGGVLSR